MSEIRILTVRQPWAWAIIHAAKDIENRSRPCAFRGTLLIQASARVPQDEFHRDCAWITERFPLLIPHDARMQFGGIVGAVQMTGCIERSDSPWFTGPVGWMLANPRPLPFTAHKGALYLQTVSNELREHLGLPRSVVQGSLLYSEA